MSDGFDQGITVTEISPMDLPIDVTRDTAVAFVGRALRGPLNTPVAITSLAEFNKRFGGEWNCSTLGSAVRQFFEHGGNRLHVVRVANNARGAMIALPAAGGMLVLRAVEPGSTEVIRASVDYDGIDDADADGFNLVVQRLAPGSKLVIDQEIFSALSCHADSPANVAAVLASSRLVRVDQPCPRHRPHATTGDTHSMSDIYVSTSQPGTDGDNISDYDLVGSQRSNTGMFALNHLDHFDVLYLPPPAYDQDMGPAALLAAEQFCRQRGAMLLVDPPLSWRDVAAAVRGSRSSGYVSPNIMTYFPRVIEKTGRSRRPRPAGGAIAGLLCRLDRDHGPWEDLDQPGIGLQRELAPAIDIDSPGARLLVREGINVLTGKSVGRTAVCGSVTLGGANKADRQFASLSVRRLCLYITNAIERATRWAVFEADVSRVSDRILGQVDGFLSHLANTGALASSQFSIQLEARAGNPAAIACGELTIHLVFTPPGAEEDISLSIHQAISGCRVAVTAFAPSSADVA